MNKESIASLLDNTYSLINKESIALLVSAITYRGVVHKEDYKDIIIRADLFLNWLNEKEKERLRWGNKNSETNEYK